MIKINQGHLLRKINFGGLIMLISSLKGGFMRKKINLNTKKTFNACCQNDINDDLFVPSRVKEVARKLDGQTLPLGEAVKKIQSVTYKKVTINRELRFITIKVGPYGLKVVRFHSSRRKPPIKKAAAI